MSEDVKQKIARAITTTVGYMNLDCEVQFRDETDEKNRKTLIAAVYVPDNARFLIGKNGQNLRALEHVVRSVTPSVEPWHSVAVDINDYKKSRATYIVDVARHAVTRVRSTQRAETLMPMTSYERRIVHMELAAYPDITTESVGQDPQRKIIIKPYP